MSLFFNLVKNYKEADFNLIQFVDIQLFIAASYDPLYFCVVCCSSSFFIYNFIYLNPLFVLVSLEKVLSVWLDSYFFFIFPQFFSVVYYSLIYFWSTLIISFFQLSWA